MLRPFNEPILHCDSRRAAKVAGLSLIYKSKNFIYYEINTSVLQELILWVGQFGGAK